MSDETRGAPRTENSSSAKPNQPAWLGDEFDKNHLFLNPRLSASLRERYVRAWREHVEGHMSAQIGIATSGSSGGEGGSLVVLGKGAFLANARSVNERLRSSAQDIWMKVLPDFHVGGLSLHARSFLSGARVLETSLTRWKATEFWDELMTSRATLLSLVPTQVFDLVRLELPAPPDLRAVIVGGGRLQSGLLRRALVLKWPLLPSYGCTECGSQVATALSPSDARLVPLSHAALRISGTGRIEISSAALLSGRIVFDGRSSAFVDPKSEGWLTTDDRGRIESDGSLVVSGRGSDFVKIGGEGVNVAHLEEKFAALRLERAVDDDIALLAAHDERLGAAIVAIAADTQDAALLRARDALIEEFNASVSPYERIRSVHGVPRLPRSHLGKLLRREAFALIGLQPVMHEGRD